jgi:hypothetical protein
MSTDITLLHADENASARAKGTRPVPAGTAAASNVTPMPASRGAAPSATSAVVRCRICDCRLGGDEETADDFEARVCASCLDRPEARRLGIGLAPLAPRRPHLANAGSAPRSAREFTPAEISLVTKVHSYMPAQQLLDILLERLRCDLGEDAQPYTMEQLQAVIQRFAPPAPAGGHDWASLRKILSQARRAGVLAKISAQLIDDFAVVYGLNARQVMALKDVLLADQGEQK